MDGSDIRAPEATSAVSTAAPAPPAEATTVAAPAESAPNGGAGDELDFGASLMEQYLSDPSHDYKTLKYGDVMDGIIAHIDREELLVDIGSKAEGIVPAREYSTLTPEEKQALSIGDTILVFVVQPENAEGHPVVSIDRARQEKSWRRLQELHEANEVIEAEVTNYNKGGLLVNLDGVRGFVPASQVSEIRGGDESSKQADMARLIGTTLPLKVIEINRHRNRLILSERQAIQERRDVMKERLIEELKEGETRKGRVSSICDFGAFVDIGGADGLVHLSELSWSRVRHPSEVLKVGQEVEVYVLGINAQEKKIALSIKRTQAEPWSRVATNYEVGQLVRGTVTQLANFGAFARIEDGIEGLIHVSELADERITHPKQVVGEGQELLLRIIRIDPQRRRMGLSLRRALDTPDAELVAVFGEGVLEERDALVQRIRAALEAEGIELAPAGRPREGDEGTGAEGGSPYGATPAVPAAATGPTDDALSADEPPLQQTVATAPGAGTLGAKPAEAFEPRPQAARSRPARPVRPAEPAVDIENAGELSAMELAFAMASAQADLVDDAQTVDPNAAVEAVVAAVESDDTVESGQATADAGIESESATEPAAAAQPALDADAGATGAESAETVAENAETGAVQTPPAEDGEDGDSVVAKVAETVTEAAGTVASAVTGVVSGVVGAVRGDGSSSDAADGSSSEATEEPAAGTMPMAEVPTAPLESTADLEAGDEPAKDDGAAE